MTCIEMQPKCKRACDRCRFKRVRCLREGDCCTRCIKDNKTCLFTDEEKKRGPKPKQSSTPSTSNSTPGIKKRRREAKSNSNQLLLSPISDSTNSSMALNSDPILSGYYLNSNSINSSSEDWSEHQAHTQAFFGQISVVTNYLQTFVRMVDPNHNLVSQQQLHALTLGFNGSVPLTMDMIFLLRCMVACTILIGTNNPLDDLFLVHYDMAVKALPHTTIPEFLSSGMTLLNFIDLTITQNNNSPVYSSEIMTSV